MTDVTAVSEGIERQIQTGYMQGARLQAWFTVAGENRLGNSLCRAYIDNDGLGHVQVTEQSIVIPLRAERIATALRMALEWLKEAQ